MLGGQGAVLMACAGLCVRGLLSRQCVGVLLIKLFHEHPRPLSRVFEHHSGTSQVSTDQLLHPCAKDVSCSLNDGISTRPQPLRFFLEACSHLGKSGTFVRNTQGRAHAVAQHEWQHVFARIQSLRPLTPIRSVISLRREVCASGGYKLVGACARPPAELSGNERSMATCAQCGQLGKRTDPYTWCDARVGDPGAGQRPRHSSNNSAGRTIPAEGQRRRVTPLARTERGEPGRGNTVSQSRETVSATLSSRTNP